MTKRRLSKSAQLRRSIAVRSTRRYYQSPGKLWFPQDDNVVCAYCGEPASTENHDGGDHVVPVSRMTEISKLDPYVKSHRVPCCTECNFTAGNHLFASFMQKKQYIQAKYFQKQVEMIEHTERELAGYGRSLYNICKRHNLDKIRYHKRSLYTHPYDRTKSEDHSNNPLLAAYFKDNTSTLQAADHRCAWSNFIYPQDLRAPYMRAKEVRSTLKITKTDLDAMVRTGEVKFTIIGQYYLFNHHEIIDYGIRIANEEIDLKEIRSNFYRLREQDKLKKI
jgi:hypothetical protein